MKRVASVLIGLALLLEASGDAGAQGVIDGRRHHLGIAGQPEWDEFAEDKPEGRLLELRFDGRANTREATLLIRQRDVKLDWPVLLNGRPIGRLLTMEAALTHALPVPAGALSDGPNRLVIGPSPRADDVIIERVALDPRPVREALGGATIDVAVTDADSGRGLPCRVTVVDARGALAPLVVEPGSRLAARPGVVYTPDGRARIGLPPGDYTVLASRGFEYGLDRRAVTLSEGQGPRVELAIRREVPTPGWVACDTHVHTLTHSGHGDATIDERAVTLAGEAIELPVMTDHDHLTDLGPAAERTGVRSRFTPVVGDEVTTKTGHFNAFPLPLDGPVPDPRLADWPSLLRAIRSARGEQVVVLNHPRDLHAGYRPFAPTEFNPITGEHRRGPKLGIDALEVVNSGAMQTDPMRPLRDWMALLNHGERITAVAASDSHDVARYIVGQGRTYVASRDDDPARIDVREACRSLRQGRALVSLGLLVQLTVDDHFAVGDLATGLGDHLRVTARVLGPSWTVADRLELYANGTRVRTQSIQALPGAVEKARIVWTLPRPTHDIHLLAIASGPGVTDPHWAIARPYQPISISWEPRVLGATNPIYIDGDSDGTWASPRSLAEAVIRGKGTDPEVLLPALAEYDEAVAAQAAALYRAAGREVRDAAFARRLEAAAEQVRRGFASVAASLGSTSVAEPPGDRGPDD